MGKRVRILTVVGMALVAGVAVGASPVQATTSTGAATTNSSHSQVQQGGDRDWIAGYYRTRRSCERAGWLGERFNRWDDYECDRSFRGHRRGWWELSVENDWRGNDHDWRGNDHDWRGNDHDRGRGDHDRGRGHHDRGRGDNHRRPHLV
jgi:hypothetical protein